MRSIKTFSAILAMAVAASALGGCATQPERSQMSGIQNVELETIRRDMPTGSHIRRETRTQAMTAAQWEANLRRQSNASDTGRTR